MQLQSALQYIKNNIIKEQVKKIPNQAKALRFFNYPYVAIEEALANAVYHKSYEERNPIEVNIRTNRIEILSIPGPLPPIDNKILKKPVVVARVYRNRRIGDFLKELDLTEGRSTGFPKIYSAMKLNGSPPPIFETDKNRNYFLTTLKIHPLFKSMPSQVRDEREHYGTKSAPSRHQVSTKLGLSWEDIENLLSFCVSEKTIINIQEEFKWSDRTKFRNKYINPLLEHGLLEMTIPDKPKSRFQKYRTTSKGLSYLKEIIKGV